MKKLIKPIIVFSMGVLSGYYLCDNPIRLFDTTYKAFQIGVYTDYDVAYTYKTRFKNALLVKDNELYRVYVAILKREDNIDAMKSYLSNNGYYYYIKDINISDITLKNKINEYERVMNSNNETVFLEINNLILESYEESL